MTTEVIAHYFNPKIQQSIIACREAIHRHPELAFKEFKTAERIKRYLEALRPDHIEGIGETGIKAWFYGTDRAAPKVAIRGDIDALPIEEKAAVPYRSRVKGIMHACGHDVHSSWVLAAGHLLHEKRPKGDVMLLFQPAEEIGEGARAMIEAAALDGVDAIIGGHVDLNIELGKAVLHSGTVSASSDHFSIRLRGEGTHGARPHEGRDPILGLGALIQGIHTLSSKRINPDHLAVVSIGKVSAGQTHNVIPDHAELLGTIRAHDPSVRGHLHKEIPELAKHIARAYGLRARTTIKKGMPSIVNKEPLVSVAKTAVSDILGKQTLVKLPFANMAAEDFAYYMEKIPGLFLRIGARTEGGDIIPAHSPHFRVDHDAIFYGAIMLSTIARALGETASL